MLSTDQYIFIGANEGLYTLNLNEIHEASMELVSSFTCLIKLNYIHLPIN